ncbi:MAG: alpha-L-fucosidase [Chitinophagaceae bacterium]|nr:alpha-L-fucosidase [Chitinophagaceae bacterium]MBL0054663.1 alpha-L-fucosidase [Chitinophagaceae bacterium]
MIRIPGKFLAVLLFCCGTLNGFTQHQDYFPDPDTAIQRRLEEWKDLKFGLLMHWGTYSQWGIVESWSICPEDLSWATGARKKGVADNYADYVKAYEKLKNSFNPVKFDPGKWAMAAKDAGMKYMVFTTKHHDGFCMFDTRFTDYKITDKDCPFSTNPKSNIAKELFTSFRKENFWVGAYFSKPDWHSDAYWWKKFPVSDRNANYSIAKYPEQWKAFTDYTHGQINELVSDYGKLDILWLDGGWVRKKTDQEVREELMETYEGSRWARNPQSQDIDMPRLVKEVRVKQPRILVVDRAVPGPQQNYLTPEQHIPDTGLPYPWETCMTMATSWSHVPGDVYKPTGEIIEKLVDIVSKGGNYLLNIGPSPEGELDSAAYLRLKEIGQWMRVNGEGIYGTRMFTVFNEGEKIRYTRSKDSKTRFIFLFDYPDGKITLSKIPFSKKDKVQLLGNGKYLDWKQTDNGVEIRMPAALKSVTDHVWVLKVTSGS